MSTGSVSAPYEGEFAGGPSITEVNPDGSARTLSAGELAIRARRAGIRDNGDIGGVPVVEVPLGTVDGAFGPQE